MRYDELAICKRNNTGMQKFYHVTKIENQESILQNGLIPQIGKNTSEVGDPKAVYLFTSIDVMEDGLINWFLDRFEETDVLVIFEIEIDVGQFWYGKQMCWEAVILDPIPPEFIKVYKYIDGVYSL